MLFQQNGLYKFASAVVIFAIVNMSNAEEGQNKVEFFGSAAVQSGQFENFKYLVQGYELTHQWIQGNILTLGLKSRVNSRVSGDLSIKSWLYYNPFPDSLMLNTNYDMNSTAIQFSLVSARASLNLSPDPQDSLLDVDIGIFPFKYNPDVCNLGEYLFRTGCYPGYIYSDGFDLACTQLSGIRVSNNLFGSWHNELFLTSELYLYPTRDFSLTYLTDYTPFANKVLNVGGAVQFFRFLPIDNAVTQPKFYEQKRSSDKVAPNWYVDNGDTGYYSFAGTKLMARFVFDPKPLLGESKVFGPDDLKLYSEAIILGVKNYPANLDSTADPHSYQKPINEFGYDKLMEKMPIMVGINLPTFKILEVLSLEAEYYGKKYVNRVPLFAKQSDMMRLPLPYDPQINDRPNGSNEGGNTGRSGLYTKSTYYGGAAQWKWSMYAKKTLFNSFSITAQAARDHSIVKTALVNNVDLEEIFIKDKQWYWMLKFGYCF